MKPKPTYGFRRDGGVLIRLKHGMSDNRSKYEPHVGRKQLQKVKRRAAA